MIPWKHLLHQRFCWNPKSFLSCTHSSYQAYISHITPPLTFINSKISPSDFGKVEAINLLAFMLSSYSSYISFLNHCQTVDSETSLHSVFSSALREPGPLIYLLFALTSMHFIALSECKTWGYEVQLAFGIIEQDITKLMHWSNHGWASRVNVSMMKIARRESSIICIASYITIWFVSWICERVRSNDSIPLHLLITFIWLIIYNSGLHITVIFTGVPWLYYIGTRLYTDS